MKKFFALLFSLLLSSCSLFGIQSEDTPVYGLMDSFDNVEIRYYHSYLIAHTEENGDYETASKQGFYRLFDYINGKNQTNQKIEMNAPVSQTSGAASEKITMTAPVFQEKFGKKWTMSFVMPAEYNLAGAPKPLDNKITIKAIPEVKVAVLKFNGFMDEANIAEKKAELLAVLKQKHIKVLSEPRSAGYNPPWTIPFLRKNEIHVDIE